MLINIFSFLLFTSFVLGQFGRIQFGQGIAVTVLDMTVFVGILCLLLKTPKKSRIVKIAISRPACIFVGICILSLLVNLPSLQLTEFLNASLYIVRLVMYFSLYFLLVLSQKQEKNRVLFSMVTGSVASVVIGFLQFFYYPNLKNLFYLGWDDHLYRLFSVFLDPNFAGVIFALLFFILLHFLFIEKLHFFLPRVFLVFLCTLTGMAVFLTYSRTGIITLLVGTIVLLLKGYIKVLLLCLLLFVIVLFASSDLRVEGLNPFRTASSNARIASVKTVITIWQKHPVLGVGFNAYRYAQHRYGYRPDGAWETSHADAGTDNSFLFVLATTGIIGLISYVYLWWKIVTRVFKRMRSKKEPFAVVTFASLIALLVSSLFLNTLFYPFILVWIAVLLAVTENT